MRTGLFLFPARLYGPPMRVRYLMPDEVFNRDLMLSVVAALKDGDLDPLFAALSPDVIWTSTAPPAFFRFGGTHRGLAGMREYTALLFSRYHYTRFAPRNITAMGDQVWGLFDVEALHQTSGRYVRYDMAIHWTVVNGKITRHQGFFDTASVLIQQGDLAA
jgi:ketosteroid isomerase-like protein